VAQAAIDRIVIDLQDAINFPCPIVGFDDAPNCAEACSATMSTRSSVAPAADNHTSPTNLFFPVIAEPCGAAGSLGVPRPAIGRKKS